MSIIRLSTRALLVPLCQLVHTNQTKWGLVKIEGKFHDRTTTPECSEDRTAVPSVVKTECKLYVCNFQLTLITIYQLVII